jgi:hypothetical protein
VDTDYLAATGMMILGSLLSALRAEVMNKRGQEFLQSILKLHARSQPRIQYGHCVEFLLQDKMRRHCPVQEGDTSQRKSAFN